jgi:thiosulfate/3-mercaptopyruvate sulfurtransferase
VTVASAPAVAPDLLVTPERLAAELREASLSGALPPLLLDTRPAEAFARGQITGAVHVDLWGVSLIDTDPAPLTAFLWMIHHVLELRGVHEGRPVVVIDQQSGLRAARAFWFLEYFGHRQVRVLDGGVDAWVRADLPLSTDPVAPTPSTWTVTAQPSRLATRDQVLASLGPATTMLDTRSDGEYTGQAVRARRGGAVPGAVHVEWTRNLDASGRFKPRADLQAMYAGAGVEPGREVITYCQGAYRAAHSYLALRLLGYPRVRVYLGSWKEWGDRDDTPVELPK